MHDDNYYKTTMAKLMNKSLANNPLLAKELITMMFEDPDVSLRIPLICDALKKDEYRDSILIIKSVKIQITPALRRICEREGIGFISIFFKNEKKETYKADEEIKVMILSKQEAEFNSACIEAGILSGATSTTNMGRLDYVSNKNPSLPVVRLSNVSLNDLKRVSDRLKKLPPQYRVCLFAKKNKEIADIAFFGKTYPMVKIDKYGMEDIVGPYPSLLIIASLFVLNELDLKNRDKCEEAERINEELLKLIDMDLDEEGTYAVPCEISKTGKIIPFIKEGMSINDRGDKALILEDAAMRLKVPNHTVAVLKREDYLKLRMEPDKEVDISDYDFYEDREKPIYVDPRELSKYILIKKIEALFKDMKTEIEVDKTLKEITEVKDRNISLAEIVSALITVGSDWREELLKNEETKGLESKLNDKYKGVTVEIEQAKEKARGKYMIDERDRDDEELEL